MLDYLEIEVARRVAAKWHDGQTRANNCEPYFTHVERVASMCITLHDEDRRPILSTNAIAAAYLHDVVEDTEATNTDIRQHFGARVAKLVDDLTKVNDPENDRATNFTLTRKKLASADPEAQTIKCFDIADNAKDIFEAKGFEKALRFYEEKTVLLFNLRAANGEAKRYASTQLQKLFAQIENAEEAG